MVSVQQAYNLQAQRSSFSIRIKQEISSMKVFVCVLALLATSCSAGFLSGGSFEAPSNGGYNYGAPHDSHQEVQTVKLIHEDAGHSHDHGPSHSLVEHHHIVHHKAAPPQVQHVHHDHKHHHDVKVKVLHHNAAPVHHGHQDQVNTVKVIHQQAPPAHHEIQTVKVIHQKAAPVHHVHAPVVHHHSHHDVNTVKVIHEEAAPIHHHHHSAPVLERGHLEFKTVKVVHQQAAPENHHHHHHEAPAYSPHAETVNVIHEESHHGLSPGYLPPASISSGWA